MVGYNMGMYDTILVPTDGSAGTERVVAHAEQLARVHDASIHALYVIDATSFTGLPMEASWEGIREPLERQGETALEEVQRLVSTVPVETTTVAPDRYRDYRETLTRKGVGRTRVWAGHGDRGLLLTRPREGPDVWTVPGTSTRTDEPIEDAALRCVREGAGLDCSLTDVYRVERVELRDRSDPEAAPLYDFVVHFDAVVGGGSPVPGSGIEAADFYDVPPDPVDRLVASRLDERDARSALGLAGSE